MNQDQLTLFLPIIINLLLTVGSFLSLLIYAVGKYKTALIFAKKQENEEIAMLWACIEIFFNASDFEEAKKLTKNAIDKFKKQIKKNENILKKDI